MNTQIPEEHFKNLIKDIQNFIKSHLQTLEKENNFLEFNVMKPQLDNIREEVKKNGWWLPQLPDSSGGMNLSLEQFGRLSACLGHSVYGHYVFNCQAPDAGNMEI
ncbi:MAG: hypothetical protein MRY83_17285, partial [Flavobacteriales bacterium]|nr:hypothetical protein [Flavobacteriales bacterium]